MPFDNDVFDRLQKNDPTFTVLQINGQTQAVDERLTDTDILRLAAFLKEPCFLLHLELSHHFISDIGFDALLKCPSIKTLRLRGNQIQARLLGLKIGNALLHLELSENPLDIYSFTELIAENKGLKSLAIEETGMSDHALLELANHPGLKSLMVSGVQLTQFGLALLAQSNLSHLSYRTLKTTTMLTDTAVLLAEGKHLSSVFVAGMTIDGLCRRILVKRPSLAFYYFDGASYQKLLEDQVRFFRSPVPSPLKDAFVVDYQPSLDEMRAHLMKKLPSSQSTEADVRWRMGCMMFSLISCAFAYQSYQMRQPLISIAFMVGAMLFASQARPPLTPQWAPKEEGGRSPHLA